MRIHKDPEHWFQVPYPYRTYLVKFLEKVSPGQVGGELQLLAGGVGDARLQPLHHLPHLLTSHLLHQNTKPDNNKNVKLSSITYCSEETQLQLNFFNGTLHVA